MYIIYLCEVIRIYFLVSGVANLKPTTEQQYQSRARMVVRARQWTRHDVTQHLQCLFMFLTKGRIDIWHRLQPVICKSLKRCLYAAAFHLRKRRTNECPNLNCASKSLASQIWTVRPKSGWILGMTQQVGTGERDVKVGWLDLFQRKTDWCLW